MIKLSPWYCITAQNSFCMTWYTAVSISSSSREVFFLLMGNKVDLSSMELSQLFRINTDQRYLKYVPQDNAVHSLWFTDEETKV